MAKISSKRSRASKKLKLLPFEGWLDKELKNSAFAARYLSESFKNDSEDNFLVGIYDVVRANGGVKAFSERTGVSRQHLHKIFNKGASPTLGTLRMMLNALGFTIDVVPLKRAA